MTVARAFMATSTLVHLPLGSISYGPHRAFHWLLEFGRWLPQSRPYYEHFQNREPWQIYPSAANAYPMTESFLDKCEFL